MRVMAATFAAALVLTALLVNHWWVGVKTAGMMAAAANFGVELPGYLKFLIKLDHFALKFGYLLIALIWVVAFLVAASWAGLRDLLGLSKPVGKSEERPFDS